MKIIVCIKQVPSASICVDENGNPDRSSAGTRLNPGDLWALEGALRLGDALGAEVTALTMGPESSEAGLRTALAMGAREAVRMTDPAFAGADVYATGHTLSQGVRALGGAELVVCGLHSTDGDTAQLPHSLGAQLGIPVLGWIKALDVQNSQVTVCQELSRGTQVCRVPETALLAIGPLEGGIRIPSLRSQLAARTEKIRVLDLQSLEDRDPDHYGLSGSHTCVRQVWSVTGKKKAEILSLSGAQAAKEIQKYWEAGTDG